MNSIELRILKQKCDAIASTEQQRGSGLIRSVDQVCIFSTAALSIRTSQPFAVYNTTRQATHLKQPREVILCCSLQREHRIHFPHQVADEVLADFGHQAGEVVAVDDQIGAVKLLEKGSDQMRSSAMRAG